MRPVSRLAAAAEVVSQRPSSVRTHRPHRAVGVEHSREGVAARHVDGARASHVRHLTRRELCAPPLAFAFVVGRRIVDGDGVSQSPERSVSPRKRLERIRRHRAVRETRGNAHDAHVASKATHERRKYHRLVSAFASESQNSVSSAPPRVHAPALIHGERVKLGRAHPRHVRLHQRPLHARGLALGLRAPGPQAIIRPASKRTHKRRSRRFVSPTPDRAFPRPIPRQLFTDQIYRPPSSSIARSLPIRVSTRLRQRLTARQRAVMRRVVHRAPPAFLIHALSPHIQRRRESSVFRVFPIVSIVPIARPRVRRALVAPRASSRQRRHRRRVVSSAQRPHRPLHRHVVVRVHDRGEASRTRARRVSRPDGVERAQRRGERVHSRRRRRRIHSRRRRASRVARRRASSRSRSRGSSRQRARIVGAGRVVGASRARPSATTTVGRARRARTRRRARIDGRAATDARNRDARRDAATRDARRERVDARRRARTRRRGHSLS